MVRVVCIRRRDTRERNKTHKKVNTLNDIKEHFVFAVSDTLSSPRDSVRHCHRRTNLNLELVRFLRDISVIEDMSIIRTEYEYNALSTHSCKILLSVVCGYPKSIISSISS